MSRFGSVRIVGIPFIDDILAEFLEMLGMVALLTIMVPSTLVILVLSFLVSFVVGFLVGFVLQLAGAAVEPEAIAGMAAVIGGLGLTFLGTVKLYRRLERVINLLAIGEFKSDAELRAQTGQARERERGPRLTAAELADIDARLTPCSSTRPRGGRRRSRRR